MIRKTIRLPDAQAETIEAAISSGAYRNQSAVIRAALRLWQRQWKEKQVQQAWPALASGPNGELNTQRVLLQGRGSKM